MAEVTYTYIGMPGPLELAILAVIFGLPAIAAVLALVFAARQRARQRELWMQQSPFLPPDHPEWQNHPADAEVVQAELVEDSDD